MKKLIVSTVVAAAALPFCAPHAQVMAHGVGAFDSCGSLVAAMEKYSPTQLLRNHSSGEVYGTPTTRYMDWIDGFVSAANTFRQDHEQISVDREGKALWMKNYCERNPERSIFSAASEMVSIL